ncbi:Uncharacterized protein TCAP_01098, partial [Tolypocladium capitatum]
LCIPLVPPSRYSASFNAALGHSRAAQAGQGAMTPLQGATVASPTTNTPPAEGRAARVVTDVVPPKVPSKSPSPAPGQRRKQPESSSQPAVGGGDANKGMAAHHRVLALNRAWEEKHGKGRGGGFRAKDSDSSDTDSESDGGDVVVPPPKTVEQPRSQAPQVAQVAHAAQAAPSTQTTRPPLPGPPSKLPANVPANPAIPSSCNQTPVPLPEYLRRPPPAPSKPEQTTDQPSIPTRASVAHRQPAADVLRAQARRFTHESVLKHLSQAMGGGGTPTRQQSTGQAPAKASTGTGIPLSATPPVKSAAGAPPAKASAGPPDKRHISTPPPITTAGEPRAKGSAGPSPSPTSKMRFATAGELLARIRTGSSPSQTPPTSAPPPSASAPARPPNVEHGNDKDESGWASSSPLESDEADDDEDLMMPEGASPGFRNKQPTKPLSMQPPTKDRNGGLERTVDGRLYGMLHHSDSNGPQEAGRGTIIPTNYELYDLPLRYICPVRDCRRLLKNMTALGGHFTAAHKGAKFNDNLDGTLTRVDTYKNPVGYSPAIVVSQNPLPLNASPPAEPSIPPWSISLKRGGNPVEPVRGGIAATPAHTPYPTLKKIAVPLPDTSRPVQGTDDVIAYLHSFLSKTQTVSYRPDIRFMERLPRLRSLPVDWIKHHQSSYLPIASYASALAYLTGDEVTGADACKQKICSTSRLSDVCIALPSSLPAYARKEFSKLSTCVGCHYYSNLYRQRNSCDWAGDERSRSGSADKGKAASPAVVPSNAATPTTAGAREDVAMGEATPPADANVRPQTPASMREPRNKRLAPALPSGVGPAPKVAKVSAGSMGWREDADLDEMEPWEFAPGRLTDDTGSENVAFSGAYLTNAQPVTVFQDVGINVIVVKPGGSNRWPMETDKLRICTVAAGKIKVKVAEKPFRIGPNGAFVVQPRQTCLVENKCYFDATIHCVTVKDYEMS